MSSSRVNERSGSSKSLVDARETFQVFYAQKIILMKHDIPDSARDQQITEHRSGHGDSGNMCETV